MVQPKNNGYSIIIIQWGLLHTCVSNCSQWRRKRGIHYITLFICYKFTNHFHQRGSIDLFACDTIEIIVLVTLFLIHIMIVSTKLKEWGKHFLIVAIKMNHQNIISWKDTLGNVFSVQHDIPAAIFAILFVQNDLDKSNGVLKYWKSSRYNKTLHFLFWSNATTKLLIKYANTLKT